MDFNYNRNALSMTGIEPVSSDQQIVNNQVYENKENIELNTQAITNLDTRVSDLEIDVAQIAINTADIAALDGRVSQNETDITQLQTDVANNTNQIAINTADIVAINYDISGIPVLMAITDINTHGDQYGVNSEIYSTNGFDTINYSLSNIVLPQFTYWFQLDAPLGHNYNFYTVSIPLYDNQITAYRFQIPISIKGNGTALSPNIDININCPPPTTYYVYKNADYFNPIVLNITSITGAANNPYVLTVSNAGDWSFELYLYTIYIEFVNLNNPQAGDFYEIRCNIEHYVDSIFNVSPTIPVPSPREITLIQTGINLNTSMSAPYYILNNMTGSNIQEDGFIVQGFNSVAGVLTKTVNELLFIGPCLYPNAANTNFMQLYAQQYLNISVNDPMQYMVYPYKHRVANFVMIFDNTNFQPATINIRIQQKVGAFVRTTASSYLTNFQFQNQSIIVPAQNSQIIELNEKVETYVNFSVVEFGTALNMQAEFIIYPYVYQLHY